jgi:hypothetical protein
VFNDLASRLGVGRERDKSWKNNMDSVYGGVDGGCGSRQGGGRAQAISPFFCSDRKKTAIARRNEASLMGNDGKKG